MNAKVVGSFILLKKLFADAQDVVQMLKNF
jgi:hypothetical protein